MPKGTRLTPLTQKDLDEIAVMSGLGLTVDKIAAIKGRSKRAFEMEAKKNEKLQCALLKGRAEAERKMSTALFEAAVDKGNVTAMIFWLKCRANWKDVSGISIQTGADGDSKAQSKLIIDLSGKGIEPKE